MRLPRQRTWPILPGVRSFLNYRTVSMYGDGRYGLGCQYLSGYVLANGQPAGRS